MSVPDNLILLAGPALVDTWLRRNLRNGAIPTWAVKSFQTLDLLNEIEEGSRELIQAIFHGSRVHSGFRVFETPVWGLVFGI